MMRLSGLAAAAALALAGQAAHAADVGLRNELRPRLEQLVPIYGDWNNNFEYGPIIQPGLDYWQGLRVI